MMLDLPEKHTVTVSKIAEVLCFCSPRARKLREVWASPDKGVNATYKYGTSESGQEFICSECRNRDQSLV